MNPAASIMPAHAAEHAAAPPPRFPFVDHRTVADLDAGVPARPFREFQLAYVERVTITGTVGRYTFAPADELPRIHGGRNAPVDPARDVTPCVAGRDGEGDTLIHVKDFAA